MDRSYSGRRLQRLNAYGILTVKVHLQTTFYSFTLQEIVPTTPVHSVAHAIPDTVDRIALLTLMNANHHLA